MATNHTVYHEDAHYPLYVSLPGGRVRHFARLIKEGPAVSTSCRKRGEPNGDGAGLPFCRACGGRSNPISQQSR